MHIRVRTASCRARRSDSRGDGRDERAGLVQKNVLCGAAGGEGGGGRSGSGSGGVKTMGARVKGGGDSGRPPVPRGGLREDAWCRVISTV
jgi:hypothetical protein